MSRRYRSTTIKVLWILCLVHQQTQITVYFKVKAQEHRCFVGCLTVVIHIRKWRLIACVVMVTSWRLLMMQNKACHSLRLKPYRCIQNIKHSCTFVDLQHLYVRDSLLCVFICTWIPIKSNRLLRHLFASVNCDVTGPLWRHQKAVSCLGWDKSISDTRRLSRTPWCTRQDDLTTVLSPQWDFLYR